MTSLSICLQASAAITSLSEASSESEDEKHEPVDKNVTDLVNMEKIFVTGVLDELKICFSSNHSVGFELLFKYYFASSFIFLVLELITNYQ